MTRTWIASVAALALTAAAPVATGEDVPTTAAKSTIPPPPTLNLGPPIRATVRGAMSGERTSVTYYFSLHPDCTSTGKVHVLVKTPPQHGRVEIESSQDYPYFEKGNVREVCNVRPTAVERVLYTSAPAFAGEDTLELEIIYSDGAYSDEHFLIHVRRPQ